MRIAALPPFAFRSSQDNPLTAVRDRFVSHARKILRRFLGRELIAKS
jgi:hypothetical protein